MNERTQIELQALVELMRRFAVEAQEQSDAAESDWWKGRQQGAASCFGLAAQWVEEILESVKN